ncbi:tetratricopeptide repeat protein [Persicimonas caeni]|uniref:Tetratricopeptide repeat protein n=1 Tax=Persicimonas caeni TaxID=2292766 RepID=A0A4Y6PVR5_PERCE|nr:tetratricopeptide repeat protein [Persicimonas caeni]QDG52451.1 tetratricopeptide repeat protein [Persicimonas caeni]QED33673.1 tetratricopeptide repeat protein [Persicimonas caeni]
MNITCPSCSAEYEVDSSRVPADGLSMRCPKCSHTFQVDPDDVQDDGGSTLLGASGRSGKVDRFFVKRPTGKVFGPFDKNAIRMMLEAGKLSGDAEVSADKESWQGLDEIPEFAEYASGGDDPGMNPGGTMLGGWASSVVDDDEPELPQARPPQLPKAKGDGPGLPAPKGADLPKAKDNGPGLPAPKGAGLPKPKGDGPGLPKPKGGRPGLPKPKGLNLPKPKGDGPGLPASKDAAGLPASKDAAGLPQSKEAGLPQSASTGLPQSASTGLPQAKSGAPDLPASKNGSLPAAKGSDSLPQAKGEDALPIAQDDDPFSAPLDDEDDLFGAPVDDDADDLFGAPADDEDDLFGAPVDDDEDDLFGAPGAPVDDDDEDDLFGAPVDDDEDDLFGAPVDDDEDDLFGTPEEDEDDLFGAPDDDDDLFDAPAAEEDDDDLFAAPVDDDPFGAPDGGADAGFGDEDSEDLFAAPADDDEDDLFEDGGLEADALFDDGGGEDDDFLSGDASFSFLDDSADAAGDDGGPDDLAGKSGEWGDDLMGSAPADDAFDTGRFDDGGGDSWDDDFGGGFDDAGLDDGGLDDDDPFRPASSGPRQPASRGIPAQKTRDEAVEEDKKRGLTTMIGVPLVALLVIGGAGYGIYSYFFADSGDEVKKVVKDTGPKTVDMKMASSDNYGDLLAVIDQSKKAKLDAGEEPKLLVVESLFLSRYDDKDVAKHAAKLAKKYANASGGWEALARGAYEAQSGSADAARSYLEPLVGESGELGYYAQLMMGVGDVIALEKHLGADDAAAPKAENEPGEKETEDAAKKDAAEKGKADGEGAEANGAEEPKQGEVADAEKAGEGAEKPDDKAAGDKRAEEAPEAKDEPAAKDKQVKKKIAKSTGFDSTAKQLAARARTALKAASEANAKAALPHYWLGRLYELGGDRQKAIAAWKSALEKSEQHIASLVDLGEAYYERGDLNNATESLEKVLSKFKQLAAANEQARAHHLVGRVHSARQQSEEAIKAYTQALSIDASRTDTLRALAEEYAAAEKYQEALNFFTSNKNLGEKDPEVMLGIVRSYMGLEKWDEAIRQLEEGEKLFPNDARFPLYLGKLNRKRGAFFDAQKALQRAVQIDPALLSAHAALAQLAWKVDEDVEKAESHIQQIRQQPEQIDAGVATDVAAYFKMSNRRDLAEQWYKASLQRDPNYWPARLALARMYLENGEDEKALTLLERAKEEGIQDIRLSAYLADAYRQSERFAKAVEQINKVIEQYPKNQEYIFIRGRIYFDQGNFDTAREDFNKAYELDPRYHDAYFFVGRTAFEQGDYKKAMKIFRHVLDYRPNEGEFRYWMGRSYEAEERLTQALEEYRKATAVDESYGLTNPQLYVRRGRLLSRLGYSVQGKQDIARALELAPDMTEALIAMGEANYGEQNYDEAIENFEDVLEKRPEHAEVQYKLGMALQYTGKELESVEHLQNAVRYGYDDPEVFRTLGYLYKRMRKNKLAVKSFKEYLKRIATKETVPVATKREMLRQIEELGGSL